MFKTESDNQIVFQFDHALQNNRATYLQLIQFHNFIVNNKDKTILLDFSNVKFISADLFALLGCSLDIGLFNNNHNLTIKKMSPKIQEVIRKNGFCFYLNWPSIEDTYNSTMRYARFDANTIQLEEFEKYLVINVFERPQMPLMNSTYKDLIIDSLLEIFNNVIDHANSNYVYVCGQYFPKINKLRFSIIDAGLTIHDNVTSYYASHPDKMPENALNWAVMPGNTTKSSAAPGGLGLPTLCDFLKENNGKLTIVSANEIYEHNREATYSDHLKYSFPGTIVNVEINMIDRNFYFLRESDSKCFIF